MIGDGKTIGTQRIKKYLATFDKADLTTQTPYGVITRRVTVTVDDTEVDMTIIDPFAALWLITSARPKISSDTGWGYQSCPTIHTVHHIRPRHR